MRLLKTTPKPIALALATLLFSGAIRFANQRSTEIYFAGWRLHNAWSSTRMPHSEGAKVLRGFIDSGGAYGNAFLLYVPHWWGGRLIGLDAGEMHWDNVTKVGDLPRRLAYALTEDRNFQLDPERGLLFFYADHDHDAPIWLPQWFPRGYSVAMESYHGMTFNIYRVPPLGREGMRQFLASQGHALG